MKEKKAAAAKPAAKATARKKTNAAKAARKTKSPRAAAAVGRGARPKAAAERKATRTLVKKITRAISANAENAMRIHAKAAGAKAPRAKAKAALQARKKASALKKKSLARKRMDPRLFQELSERVAVSTPTEFHRQRVEERNCPFEYTVVIPAYNEGENLAALLEKLKLVTGNVVLVDDGSTDRTWKIGKRFGLKVVRHAANLGKGAAIRTGVKAAETEKIVLIDADNQHSPYEIPIFAERLKNADFVIGNRFSSSQSMPAHRLIANNLLRALVKLRAPINDPLCGFRAFRKSALRFDEEGFAADLEMVFEAVDKGLRIEQVPVAVSYDIRPKETGKTAGILSGAKEYASLFFYTLKWLAGLR